MLDLASKAAGGRVLMVSSLDYEHPGCNVIDGGMDSFWISTGLYPQEILLELGRRCPVSSVQLASTSVRSIRIEGSQEAMPVNFQKLAEASLRDTCGQMQLEEFQCHTHGRTGYVRVVILSGWHDFCSVHRIRVEAPQSVVDALPPEEVPEPVCETASLVTRDMRHEGTAPSHPEKAQWIERVRQDGLALRFAQELIADRDVVLAAVQHSGDALQFASDGLRGSREIVLAAVQKKGSAIRWALPELRSDPGMGLAAVRQNGNALQFCDNNLKADRRVVLAAVQQHGTALRWAKKDLRGDHEVIELASRTFFWTKRELAELEEAEDDEDEDEDDRSDN